MQLKRSVLQYLFGQIGLPVFHIDAVYSVTCQMQMCLCLIDSLGLTTSTRCLGEWRRAWKLFRISRTPRRTVVLINRTTIFSSLA